MSLLAGWLVCMCVCVCVCVCVYAVLYPHMSSAPRLIGPLYVHNVMYLGAGSYTDFYFICRINYAIRDEHQQKPGGVMMDDGARFEVTLTFDAQLISAVTKITTSSALDVQFTSHDLRDGFGTNVRSHRHRSVAHLTVSVCSSTQTKRIRCNFY